MCEGWRVGGGGAVNPNGYVQWRTAWYVASRRLTRCDIAVACCLSNRPLLQFHTDA